MLAAEVNVVLTTSVLVEKVHSVRDSGLIHLTGSSVEVSSVLKYSLSSTCLESPKSATLRTVFLSSLETIVFGNVSARAM